MHHAAKSHNPTRRRRGFTLLEALMSAVILTIVLVALIQAVSSANRVAFVSQKQVLGACAADDLAAELMTIDYADLDLQDGRDEPIGTLTMFDGSAYPDSFARIGRRARVERTDVAVEGLPDPVPGKSVTIETFDEVGVLARVEVFVPEGVQ
ncbi:MAG: prepilin-type N-terminal cleavage/methylation domain-containing protein [Planctomycetota bacterium]